MTHPAAHPLLDHAVINVHADMDHAHAQFTRLGFQLTPRGYHTLGSINHLAMFDMDYLELIGVPEAGEGFRRELLEAPRGANGLVWQTLDADDDQARLTRAGLKPGEVKAFSRPVQTESKTAAACFKTTTLTDSERWGGRVYWCEHLTPELVWRPQWQTHSNGTYEVATLEIVSEDVASTTRDYTRLAGPPVKASASEARWRCGTFYVRVLSVAELNSNSPFMAFVHERPVQMARLGFRVYDLSAAARLLESNDVRVKTDDMGLLHVHPDDACGAYLYFTE